MKGEKSNNFMEKALEAAGDVQGEIPVGAVIVKGGEVVACACNKKEALNDVSAHAEILAIREASAKFGRWRLEDCTMYITLEPCPMCAWAIINAHLKAVYFGAYDTQYGALGSAVNLRTLVNSKLQVYGGIMESECNALLNTFFKEVRGGKGVRGKG